MLSTTASGMGAVIVAVAGAGCGGASTGGIGVLSTTVFGAGVVIVAVTGAARHTTRCLVGTCHRPRTERTMSC